LGDLLLLDGFAEVTEASYAPLLQWDQAAIAAGYALPADELLKRRQARMS
jgi:hypothetical protein